MGTTKDSEQDLLIRENAERIARNEKALERQTMALELIRDHYYPPKPKLWRRIVDFALKALCVVLAYSGGVQALDWYFNVRKANAMAERCVTVARRLFYTDGNTESAAKFYEKAISLNDRVDYRLEQSFVHGMATVARLADLGRPYTESESALVQDVTAEASMLRTLAPDHPMSLILMAQAQVLGGDRESAVKSITDAIALDPSLATTHSSACAIFMLVGRVKEAREQLAEAERLDASLPLIPHWKGVFAMCDRDYALARRHFAEMTRRTPRLAVGYAMLGRSCLAGTEPDLAAAHEAFRRALELDERHPMALLGMAETCEREGNLQVARLWLDRVLEGDANNMKALLGRARVAGKAGRWKDAADDLSSAIALAPMRADLYRQRETARTKIGDKAGAAADRDAANALARVQTRLSRILHN